jgi:hypothetical protein
MKYFLKDAWCNDDTVTVLPEGATLLDDAAWAARHGAPVLYVAPRITKVTMRQARLALLSAGYLSTINAAIANMAGAQGEAARIEWEYSQEVQRDRGLVLSLGTSLGLTESQLDALFVTAASIP